ncbi:PKD domain-containing protein [Candidatus Peribacteria bacterium]|nr:MAG: PKD domain-containing protein [Candidatus Peribacteria bacterium]
MMHTFKRTVSGILMTSLLCLQIGIAGAQDTLMMDAQAGTVSADTGSEQISLVVGDILEVLPSHSFSDPVYSWILTQDRTFLQAARTSMFRYRFIQPGTYSLIAEIKSGDGQRSVLRTFVISAKARTAGNIVTGQPSVQSGSNANLTGLVRLDPPMDTNERVILRTGQQLLKLSPINPELKPLSLDLNVNVDADGDGNASNDVENQGTFFQLYAEPLYVWFAEPITSRMLSVIAVGTDGAARVQNIETFTTEYAQQQNIVVSPIRIKSTPTGNGAVTFEAVSGNAATTSTSLLYTWTFGDGQESLIMNPAHTYAADGVYTVTLKVKNLIDGQDVAVDQQQITIQGAGGMPASAASSETSTPSGESFLSGLPVMSILIGLGIFALFVVLGLGAVFLLGKLRGGKSLDQTFADMEKTIVAKEEDAKNPPALVIPATATQVVKTPAPAVPTKEDISIREENAASAPTPAATPRIDEKAAPEWLKKGLDSAPKPATPAPAAVSTPAAAKPAPVAAPTPAPTPASTPAPATTPTAPTPSWLQTPPATPAATPSKPDVPAAPKPAPVATPVPTPAPVVPKPPVVAQPAVAAAVPTPAAPAPQQTPTPAPVKAPVTPPTPVVAPAPKPAPVAPSMPTTAPVKPPVLPTTPVTQPVAKPTPAVVPTPTTTVATTPSPIVPPVPKPAPVPTPAPQQTPAPVVTPKPPVPVTTPTPAPKPVVMPPVLPTAPASTPSAPVQNPVAPVAPAVPKPTAPVAVPQPIQTPKPAPVAPPTPVVTPPVLPKPVTPPVVQTPPVPAPIAAPAAQSVPVAPIQPIAPVQAPIQQQAVPEIKPPVLPATPPQKPADTPIAIIRAESLDKPQGGQS